MIIKTTSTVSSARAVSRAEKCRQHTATEISTTLENPFQLAYA
jgi:hypothetical protein